MAQAFGNSGFLLPEASRGSPASARYPGWCSRIQFFARREVVSGSFIRGFIKAPDEVFKDCPHRNDIDDPRVEVYVRKVGDSKVESVGLFEFLNFLFKLETNEDFAHVFREAVNVVGKMPTDVVGVTLELLEIQIAMIVETKAIAICVGLWAATSKTAELLL